MKLNKIIVGSQTYSVRFDSDACELVGAVGLSHRDKQLILLKENVPKDSLADTLIHEVLHTICYNYIPDVDGSDEETIVTFMAHGLTQVIRDNPEFMKEVKKLLK